MEVNYFDRKIITLIRNTNAYFKKRNSSEWKVKFFRYFIKFLRRNKLNIKQYIAKLKIPVCLLYPNLGEFMQTCGDFIDILESFNLFQEAEYNRQSIIVNDLICETLYPLATDEINLEINEFRDQFKKFFSKEKFEPYKFYFISMIGILFYNLVYTSSYIYPDRHEKGFNMCFKYIFGVDVTNDVSEYLHGKTWFNTQFYNGAYTIRRDETLANKVYKHVLERVVDKIFA